MSGPRVYEVEEANELIPSFETAFEELDDIRARLKASKIKLNALEMIWGTALNQDENPDNKEGVSLLEELKNLEEQFGAVVQRLNSLSATVKDLDMGLVDVYHVRDGHLVCLCWKRGEDAFDSWHDVDSGFDSRQEL